MSAWQPIATAPKDGKRVLLWCICSAGAYDAMCLMGYQLGQELEWHSDECMTSMPIHLVGYVPTHWMPLPPPPEVSE
jgi:hypothetical protein